MNNLKHLIWLTCENSTFSQRLNHPMVGNSFNAVALDGDGGVNKGLPYLEC